MSDVSPSRPHIPVLLAEVLDCIGPRDGETYVDGTLGAGGYSRALLEAAQCRVLALDRDPRAILGAQSLIAEFPGRLSLMERPFSELADAVVEDQAGRSGSGDGVGAVRLVDAVVLDIGVSSMQLDQAERGFSFMTDGPLDMRMGAEGPSAASIVNEGSEAHLADILFHLGEERQARRIAKFIVAARANAPITRTRELARVVEKAIGRGKGDEKHPATRTFQALRIFVNDELGELMRGLEGAEGVLKPGGRLVVVTFHSLEDRIVKRFLTRRSGKADSGSRHGPPQIEEAAAPSFRIVNRSPLTPSQPELDANPRARSAKLRAAIRTEASAWTLESATELGIPMPAGGWRE